jgi:pimeloyl-ACP methyl ester carboxylesterase
MTAPPAPAARVVLDDTERDVLLEVLLAGAGDDVVLVPSAMRGATDFEDLQRDLADAGYRSLALNPRGAGRSTPPTTGVTLRDLADDVAFVASTLASGPVHLVGHALGNVVVRATASYRPEVAATVTVMPCGGHDLGVHPVAPEVLAAFGRCQHPALSDVERLEALRIAFFAAGNDASAWLDGWWPSSTFGAVLFETDPEEWWRAGTVPILIVQPLEDAMSPIEAGREAAVAFGDRATYVEVARCGHAILPEQPEVVAGHVIDFLGAHQLR